MPAKRPASVPNAHKRIELQAQNAVYGVAFTADGRHVVGGESGGTIQQWRLEDGMEVSPRMSARGDVYSLVVSPDGQWIVTGDWGQKVIVWESATHRQVLEISDHSGDVNTVDVSSDSRRIVSGSDDKTVRIFDLTNGSSLIAPFRHDDRVYGVKFSPAGDLIATATRNESSVRVYDTRSGDKLFTIPVEVRSCPITPLAWSYDGQHLFVSSPGKITSFNLSTSSRSEWTLHNDDSKTSVVTNGRFIACSSGTSVSLWDAFSQKQIGPVIEHPEAIHSITLSPDERHLACGHDNKITIHDLGEVLPLVYFQGYPLSQPPLMHVTELVLQSWSHGDLVNTESMLSEDIERCTIAPYNAHALANRALIRIRLSQWDSALDDANKSLQINPSPVAYIAIALCHMGKGDKELALQEFDIVFSRCDSCDNVYLLLVKAVLSFVFGKRESAVSRMRRLIAVGEEDATYYHHHVLATMYLKRREYERAIQTLERAKHLSPSKQSSPLVTISLIFGWTFEEIQFTAYQRLCESLYASGRVKELWETLSRVLNSLDEDDKEAAHGRILEAIVTRSGEANMLAWTGKSCSKNTCLPSSLAVYTQRVCASSSLERQDLERRVSELRALFSPLDAGIIYGRVTRLQPVRFAHFRLHLPCIVFPVTSLSKDERNVYHARVAGLGEVAFTTEDSLPLNEPRKLVFVNPWVSDIVGSSSGSGCTEEMEFDTDPDEDSVNVLKADSETELVRVSIVEEVPPSQASADDYTKALQLIARLGEPFTALLLLRQPDGSYRRVAADHEIVIPGLGTNVPKDIRSEVLEVL